MYTVFCVFLGQQVPTSIATNESWIAKSLWQWLCSRCSVYWHVGLDEGSAFFSAKHHGKCASEHAKENNSPQDLHNIELENWNGTTVLVGFAHRHYLDSLHMLQPARRDCHGGPL